MATNYSIQGALSGRLGNMIGYRMFGKNYVRSMPSHYHDRRSAAQLGQRGRFKTMIQTAQQCVSILQRGLTAWGRPQHLTAGNAFLKLNHGCFGRGVTTEEVSIDYRRLQFSAGPVGSVAFGEITVDGEGVWNVSWEKQMHLPMTRNDDLVHVAVYCPGRRCGAIVATAERRAKGVRFVMPEYFAGYELYVYGFVEDPQGRCSATAWIEEGQGESIKATGRTTPEQRKTADTGMVASQRSVYFRNTLLAQPLRE